MDLILTSLTLVVAGASSLILLADIVKGVPANRAIPSIGGPAFFVLAALAGYSYTTRMPLWDMIFWGVVGGILGTVALDSVRIPGYLLGYMPLDLPIRFGTKALGLDKELMTRMIMKVSNYVLEQINKGVSTTSLMDERGLPRLSVREVRSLIRPTVDELCKDKKISINRLRVTGYLWHYSNGASFGIAHLLLFGKGSWIFTFAFGLLLATVFLSILKFLVPVMRPDAKLASVVILAHFGVIAVLLIVTQIFVPQGSTDTPSSALSDRF